MERIKQPTLSKTFLISVRLLLLVNIY